MQDVLRLARRHELRRAYPGSFLAHGRERRAGAVQALLAAHQERHHDQLARRVTGERRGHRHQ